MVVSSAAQYVCARASAFAGAVPVPTRGNVCAVGRRETPEALVARVAWPGDCPALGPGMGVRGGSAASGGTRLPASPASGAGGRIEVDRAWAEREMKLETGLRSCRFSASQEVSWSLRFP